MQLRVLGINKWGPWFGIQTPVDSLSVADAQKHLADKRIAQRSQWRPA